MFFLKGVHVSINRGDRDNQNLNRVLKLNIFFYHKIRQKYRFDFKKCVTKSDFKVLHHFITKKIIMSL